MKNIIFTFFCFMLSSCGVGNNIESYAGYEPKIDIREFFNGKLEGWGAIYNRSGVLTSSFSLKIDASWEDNLGNVNEVFNFYDGSELNRNWKIEYSNNGRYKAVANDIKGEAYGRQVGNAMNTSYNIMLPYGKSYINLSADDWVYKLDDKNYFSKISLYKFGFKVSEIIMYVKKTDQ